MHLEKDTETWMRHRLQRQRQRPTIRKTSSSSNTGTIGTTSSRRCMVQRAGRQRIDCHQHDNFSRLCYRVLGPDIDRRHTTTQVKEVQKNRQQSNKTPTQILASRTYRPRLRRASHIPSSHGNSTVVQLTFIIISIVILIHFSPPAKSEQASNSKLCVIPL